MILNTDRRSAVVLRLVCALAFLAIADRAGAATCTWTGEAGGGTDNRWSQAQNWNCDGVIRAPTTSVTEMVVFPEGAKQPANVDDIGGLSVFSLDITGRAAGNVAWTITPAM